MKKTITVISYYSNVNDSCQAEWVDDRINAFLDEEYFIVLYSSILSKKHKNSNIKHFRTPSLSPNSFEHEYREIQKRKIGYGNPTNFFIFSYFIITQIFKKIAKSLGIKSGEGRWSWFPVTFLVSILSRKVVKSDFIYTTGGPASPHIVGILIGKIFNKRVVCELQDPLSGKDIGRNSFSAMGLKIIESFIINNSTITLFCTRNAMLAARDRYKSRASNIDYVYPGSNKTKKVISIGNNVGTSKINITYLGSLYQTRNIDSLMTAIKLMNQQEQSLIEINLYGHLNPDIKQRILEYKESSINIHGMVPRTEALKKGELADVLLLVQHSDERSITTMPFKTYDYLHSGKLILGLIFKNDEIKEILISHGHLACQVDDIQAIQQAIRNLIENKKMLIQGIKECDITPKIAVKKMLTYFN